MRQVVVIYAETGLNGSKQEEISIIRQNMNDIQQVAGGFTGKSIDRIRWTEDATFYAFKPEGPYYNEMAWNAEHSKNPPGYGNMLEVREKTEIIKKEQGNAY